MDSLLPATPQADIEGREDKEVKAETLSYRAALLQQVTPRIPMTAEGLPVGFYRVDLLPQAEHKDKEGRSGREGREGREEVQSLKNAYTDLSFDHGYPTLNDGRPFWLKLDFEPSFEYGAFQIYLDHIDEGPRELSQLSQNAELLQLFQRMHPERVAKANGSGPHVALHQLLNEASILYAWRPRAKAYDLYKEAAYRHMRLRRQMTVEDRHFKLADTLLKKLELKVLGEPKFFDDMSAKTAADLLSKLVSIQRVSVGLPAQGPLSNKEASTDTTFEMILRSLGQKAFQGTSGDGGSGNIFNQAGALQGREVLNRVLGDSDTTEKMQEIIIRVTKASQTNQPENPHQGVRARTFKGRGRTNEILNDEDLVPFDIDGAPGVNENLDPVLDSDSDSDSSTH